MGGAGPPGLRKRTGPPSPASDLNLRLWCCREKKELQKILDRKRHNSISEAKTREKHKKEV